MIKLGEKEKKHDECLELELQVVQQKKLQSRHITEIYQSVKIQ